jgi:hypothetical protein
VKNVRLGIIFMLAVSAVSAQGLSNATLPLPPNPPPLGAGIPDLNGIWQMPYTTDLTKPLGGPVPFTEYGKSVFQKHLGGDDPHGFCQPTGPTRAFHQPYPFQIVQTPGMVIVLFEIDHNFRRIFTDGRGHPPNVDFTWYGDSIGKYEGDTLRVDTIGLNEKTWLDTAGHQHSDKLHITETFTRTGPDTVKWTVTYDDPVFYTKPLTISLDMKRQKYDIMEMICMENNLDLPHFNTSQKEGSAGK